MARRARRDEPGAWLHIMNRGVARRPMFRGRADIRFFLSLLAREVRRETLEIHAWCVLTTHYHLLVRSPTGDVSGAMERIQRGYSRRFNREERRDGPLVRGRFTSRRVGSLAYRSCLVRYIDANPVQAGLVDVAWRYPFGSAAQYVHRKGPKWLERTWVEAEVCCIPGVEGFSANGYQRRFNTSRAQELVRLVESRWELGEAASAEIDDLIGAAAPRVRAWMVCKSRVGDGLDPGTPITTAGAVEEALGDTSAMLEGYVCKLREGPTRLLDVALVGLLRDLCALTWPELVARVGRTRAICLRLVALHRELVATEPEYAEEVAARAALAIRIATGAEVG